MPVTPIEERLASLQAHYAERINAAVAAGRMDLVRDLANDYEDEALELILATAAHRASRTPGRSRSWSSVARGRTGTRPEDLAVLVLAA